MTFETDEETSTRAKENLALGLIILILATVATAGIITYEAYKPLPNLPACEKIGFEAGQIINEKTVCYDDCENNHFTNCKTKRVLT